MGYVVSWSMSFSNEDLAEFSEEEYSATGARRAAQMAHGWLEDAIKHDGGATVLVVRDEDDNHLGTFDEFGHGEEIKRNG